jgi:Fe-S-cluster-containing dehydrogenase component/formate-dependent nitrite reductase membrane component NrfD
MMKIVQYGFLIDHRRCIGCHACTVACKAENGVPVGSFRTWVKYTEKGRFPEIKRHFAVLRCNHCTSAPCVTICPVNALEKRPDGIVDIDRDACIGCRACMQACPYDAIYLNEDSGAVEKCHYCAHRVEKDLEPACVTVCPVGAIIPGDLHDPESRIARMAREHDTTVRRPEQGTEPNVYYLGVEPIALEPGAALKPDAYLWSERLGVRPEPWPDDLPLVPDTRTVLDVDHKVEWGGAVAGYLVVKGIAAGMAILAPFVSMLGLRGFAADYLPEIVALIFTAITTFLLVEDLHRPRKFLTLLTRPNWRSWLVKGAVLLIAFSAVLASGLLLRWGGRGEAADAARWVAAALGVGVAGYTAFLFGQCEGRDLWQSPWLLPHLLAQAAACGAAAFLPWSDRPRGLSVILVIALGIHFGLAWVERFRTHATANARQAAAFLPRLRYGLFNPFREALWIGVLIPLLLLPFGVGAGWLFVPVLFGLYLYEWAYVRAGQLPPLS